MLRLKSKFIFLISCVVGFFVSSLLLPVSALAEENGNSWKGGAELGFVSTDGNSNTKTVNAKLDIKKSWSDWADNFKLDALNSKQEVLEVLKNTLLLINCNTVLMNMTTFFGM